MSFYRVHIKEPWYSLIKNGKKTSEGRLNKGIFSQMKEGDIVEWFNSQDIIPKNFKTKITKVIKYKSFYECIKNEGLENILPVNGINNIEQGVKEVYYKYYTPGKEKKFGVLAIRVKLIE